MDRLVDKRIAQIKKWFKIIGYIWFAYTLIFIAFTIYDVRSQPELWHLTEGNFTVGPDVTEISRNYTLNQLTIVYIAPEPKYKWVDQINNDLTREHVLGWIMGQFLWWIMITFGLMGARLWWAHQRIEWLTDEISLNR